MKISFICENERTIYRIVCDTSIGKYQGPRVESHSDPIHMKGKENTIYMTERKDPIRTKAKKRKKTNIYLVDGDMTKKSFLTVSTAAFVFSSFHKHMTHVYYWVFFRT